MLITARTTGVQTVVMNSNSNTGVLQQAPYIPKKTGIKGRLVCAVRTLPVVLYYYFYLL